MRTATRPPKYDAPIEPGLLWLFRLTLVIQLILVVIFVVAHARIHYMVTDPCATLAFGAVGSLLLLVYLSSARLRRRLGRCYLPLALALSAIFSLVLQDLFLVLGASVDSGGSEERAWLLFLFLFSPLVLTGWQYNFKAVTLFCVFTAVLDFLLIRLGGPGPGADSSNYIRLILIRTFAFLVVGHTISHIMRRMRAQQADLQQANRKLTHYAATLEQLTLSRERNRLARELHDTLAHTLSGLAVQLEGVKALWDSDLGRAYGLLDDSLAATRRGLVETRAAIRALRSEPLENLGIELALHELARSAAERAGFRLRFEGPGQELELSDDVEQCLYRVGQEALENIVSHAQAGAVAVRLEHSPAATTLTICDDGVGFEPDGAGRAAPSSDERFGLRGMRERAELAGGRLSVVARPGCGVTIRLEIPHDEHPRADL